MTHSEYIMAAIPDAARAWPDWFTPPSLFTPIYIGPDLTAERELWAAFVVLGALADEKHLAYRVARIQPVQSYERLFRVTLRDDDATTYIHEDSDALHLALLAAIEAALGLEPWKEAV